MDYEPLCKSAAPRQPPADGTVGARCCCCFSCRLQILQQRFTHEYTRLAWLESASSKSGLIRISRACKVPRPKPRCQRSTADSTSADVRARAWACEGWGKILTRRTCPIGVERMIRSELFRTVGIRFPQPISNTTTCTAVYTPLSSDQRSWERTNGRVGRRQAAGGGRRAAAAAVWG